MNKRIFIFLIFSFFILAGFSCQSQSAVKNIDQPVGVALTGEIKEFNITAKQFEFIPSEITVNQGDKVKLNITSVDAIYGFNLAAFGINITLEPNQMQTVEFIADKKGVFTFGCSLFCNSGHSAMKGNFIVK